MNSILKIGITLSLSLIYTACIKQQSETCPPLYRAVLTVKDKNYSNAADIPGFPLRDEQQPFKTFIPNFSYQLFHLESGSTADSMSDFIVQDNDMSHTIDFSNIQAGTYILNLFGNTTQPIEQKNNVTTYNLHPSGQEGDDVYFFLDTIHISPEKPEVKVPLTRTKGALWIQIENLPDSVVKIEETIQHIYKDINANSLYSDDISVTKEFTSNLHPTSSLLTLLAPTVLRQTSVLRLALYTQGATIPFMFIPDVPLTIKRNEVTAFKFNFNLEGGIEVWISSNGTWQKMHDLDITNNE